MILTIKVIVINNSQPDKHACHKILKEKNFPLMSCVHSVGKMETLVTECICM